MSLKSTQDFSSLSLEESLRILESSLLGLSSEEARARLSRWGYNEIPQSKPKALPSFLKRFWGPMPWLLEIAIAFSFFLGRVLEGSFISVLLFLNALIGFWHGRSSAKTVELLKRNLRIRSQVLRDGSFRSQDARELVPGDIIFLKQGDLIPVDGKVLQGQASVDQSSLTGESLPVSAREGEIVYAGSIIQRGEMRILVLNTGIRTLYGKALELVSIARPKSHQEKLILKVIKYSLFCSLFCILLASIYGLVAGLSFFSILEFDLTLLMGALPVAIPVMLTIMEAAGALELSRKGILVTRLDSVEDAISLNVLCLDKTGTLTENSLTVEKVYPLHGSEEEVLIWAGLASEEASLDPIDLAILRELKKRKIDLPPYRRLSFIPFDPSTRRAEVIVENEDGEARSMKGAPQAILEIYPQGPESEALIAQEVEQLSLEGARSLVVAREKDGKNEILGVIGLFDPPRVEAAATISRLKELNVKPIMLTGDNLLIAKQIARQVGIGPRVIRYCDLTQLPQEDYSARLKDLDGIAEIFPEDKYQIVKHLQELGQTVGMTGDGVNDAPALKQAELGIAVDNATDAARASASVVLTRPGVDVILDCLILSRKIFQRTLTWILNKIIKVVEFSLLLTVGFLWLKSSILPLMYMALLILANDFATMSLARDRVEYSSYPNVWKIGNITLAALVPGLLFFLEDLLLLFAGRALLSLAQLPTFILLTLVFNSQMRIMLVRERRHFWSSLPGQALALAAFLTVLLFLALATMGGLLTPLPLWLALLLFLFTAFSALLFDFPKFLLFQKLLQDNRTRAWESKSNRPRN